MNCKKNAALSLVQFQSANWRNKVEIVFASSNKFKIKEISSVASSFGIKISSPSDIAKKLTLPNFEDPVEDGKSYEENALIKARACYTWCGLPSLGDDSGLDVDILNGAPGIYSARYAGPGASDNDRIAKLLFEVNKASLNIQNPSRKARFRCNLALILGDNKSYKSEGILEGQILSAPQGNRGFGYDPIVLIDAFGATLAEVSEELVITEGFRAQAAKKLFSSLTIA